MNNGPMHVGKDEWHPGVKCFLDDLRVYNVALAGILLYYIPLLFYLISHLEKEIEALVGSSNPLIGPTYTKLGCESCNYIDVIYPLINLFRQ